MNFKHLRYFWVVAKAGGVMRAGEQLHTTPQTLSGQIKLFEDWIGHKLFRKVGRRLELTEQGRIALDYAEEIFALGAELETAVRHTRGERRTLEFRVGVADAVAKSVVYQLLEPALEGPEPVRLICHEGKYDDLLARLALHRLDLLIADERVSPKISVRAFSHLLGRSSMSFFCSEALRGQLAGAFPQCLDGMPMLVQSRSSSVRRQLDPWLVRMRLRPRIIGEFDDTALMNAFGREGRGVFMAPSVLEAQIAAQYRVHVLGRVEDLFEEFFAISVERRISHPGVAAITQAARAKLFHA
ncbi:transcriptional activator NhaR [Pseudorhodoferax sp.]|uniref:transcriptional activator NhaR n=1 Tax=Pseudorhodoferax sp. TaxID=1993553 RepID=UPI0039E37A12